MWLFLSPWFLGIYTIPNPANNWIVGALIVLFAAIRFVKPASRAMSWWSSALGVWIFASRWIYAYTSRTGDFINSICIGLIVFFTSVMGANIMPHGTRT
jgi:hypothetical protein